jgi:phosphatidate cytidylyltransferase
LTNTQKRIASAIVLIIFVMSALIAGRQATLGFILALGCLIVFEIQHNFFKKRLKTVRDFTPYIIFVTAYMYINFMDRNPDLFGVMVNAALLMNLGLIAYLFLVDMNSKFLMSLGRLYPEVSGIYVLLGLSSLSAIFLYGPWEKLLGILLLVNFGMDTGAWFFGKRFGKHKLWPTVSPNKTIEGLVGGAITSGILGGLGWHLLIGGFSVSLFVLFCFLGIMSQIGDLIQSKIKRQFNLKDSSTLIPGHGGVYDRVDSLLFSSPFYILVLKYFYIS